MTTTGIVLAGGRSSRMGQDKALLPFGNETMVERAVRIVGSVTGDVIVVGRFSRAGSSPMPGGGNLAPRGGGNPFLGLPVRTVHDPVSDLGPLAGIAAGLSASHTDLNLIVACDMPLIRPAVLQRLLDLRDESDICVAVVDGHASPLCAVYRTSVGAVARELLAAGERRVMSLLDRVRTKRVDATALHDIDPHLDSFLSCNTPEAYQQALVRLKADATSA